LKRVVVTGMAGLSPLGNDWESVSQCLLNGRSGVEAIPEWAAVEGLQTRLGAPVHDFEVPDHWTRKKIRTMGRVSLLSTRATELALEDAGLLGSPEITDGSTGISHGSTSGSPPMIGEYSIRLAHHRSLKGLAPQLYIQFMSHTTAANMGQFFGVQGRILTTCSACTSGSQGIGYGYESVRNGQQAIMIAGGAEELHVAGSAVFDVMYATSTLNDTPTRTPRPFDQSRDGLVIGEGAATLILEELEHALARKATIHAEVVGYATNCDGSHMVNPSTEGMEAVMRQALNDAGLAPSDIGYVNAHGTATEIGDIAESQATARVFGDKTPVSTLKGHMGHTLGAAGALEAWMSICMMRERWFSATLNLTTVDKRCSELDYIRSDARKLHTEHVMSNNFAFGGINTSLIFRKFER
jgi:3-oxoacyl-[acyl-carrier-protein] synthase II